MDEMQVQEPFSLVLNACHMSNTRAIIRMFIYWTGEAKRERNKVLVLTLH